MLHYEINTNRLLLKILDSSFYRHAVKYQSDNRDHFLDIYPKLHVDYYSEIYQMELLRKEFRMALESLAFRYYIFNKDDIALEKIVGDISITNILEGNACSCKIGYKLDKDETGKGYMTEAMKKIISHVFDVLGLQRIEVNILPRNAQSSKLAKKLGFCYEGTAYSYLKVHDKWEDHDRYSLIKSKYYGENNE